MLITVKSTSVKRTPQIKQTWTQKTWLTIITIIVRLLPMEKNPTSLVNLTPLILTGVDTEGKKTYVARESRSESLLKKKTSLSNGAAIFSLSWQRTCIGAYIEIKRTPCIKRTLELPLRVTV